MRSRPEQNCTRRSVRFDSAYTTTQRLCWRCGERSKPWHSRSIFSFFFPYNDVTAKSFGWTQWRNWTCRHKLCHSRPHCPRGKAEKRNYKSSFPEDDSAVISVLILRMDGVCVDGRVLHARHLVCVCASRDYSLTWDEGADGLEIAQSGREKRVVGKAMMEWSRAGWMDGRRDCQMQGSCMYSPSFYVRLFSPYSSDLS